MTVGGGIVTARKVFCITWPVFEENNRIRSQRTIDITYNTHIFYVPTCSFKRNSTVQKI